MGGRSRLRELGYSIAISICGWARSKSTVVNTFPHSRARVRVCAVCAGRCVVCVGGAAGRTGSRAVASRSASDPLAVRPPAKGDGEDQAAGSGLPENTGWECLGVRAGVACGVWRVWRVRASRAAGSEVVRDEFIGGLENTDQVVFLISLPRARPHPTTHARAKSARRCAREAFCKVVCGVCGRPVSRQRMVQCRHVRFFSEGSTRDSNFLFPLHPRPRAAWCRAGAVW